MGDGPDRVADANHAAIALFSAIVALVIAVIGYLLAFGFSDNSPLDWAKYVGLSWFLIHFSLVARTLLRLDGAGRHASWWASHPCLTLAALVLAALASVAGPGARSTTFDASHLMLALLSFLGAAGFCFALVAAIRLQSPSRWAGLLAFAGLFSFYAAGAAWGTGEHNPLFVQALSFGRAPIDALYHASICNMLRTYGVPSTGLDGLPYFTYHVGSHWIFARLCNLLDVRVVDFYNRGYPVVFIPFGVFSLGTFAVCVAQKWERIATRLRTDATATRTPNEFDELRSLGSHEADGAPRPIGFLFWLIISLGYVGFLPYASGFMPIAGWNSIILSESYAVAVAVSLLFLAAAWSFVHDVFVASGKPRRAAFLVGALLLVILVAALGFLKISVMLVLVATAGFFFVRLRLYRSVPFGLLGMGVLLATAAAYAAASDTEYFAFGESRFAPFGFPRANVEPQWWPDYWFIYYAWLWVLAAARFREEGIRTLQDVWNACRQRRLLDLEFVIVAALVGAAPGLIMKYSSTHYFSNYQQWLALGFLLSMVIRRRRPFGKIDVAHDPSHRHAGHSALGQVTVRSLLLGLVLLSLAGTLVSNTVVLVEGMDAVNLTARGRAGGGTGVGVALLHGRWHAAADILRQSAEKVESRMETDTKIITVLNSLDELPLAEKRRSLLFIPKSNRLYWNLLHGPYWPKEGPLVAPALSGVAMIDGLYVPGNDDPWMGHGYNRYSKPEASRVQPPLPQYLPILRSRCAQRGFSQLIVIDSTSEGSPVLRKYDCP